MNDDDELKTLVNSLQRFRNEHSSQSVHYVQGQWRLQVLIDELEDTLILARRRLRVLEERDRNF